jgi:serine/threonine protein kinase
VKTPPRFRIIRELGEGGSGVVYEAFDQERQTRIAVKRLDDMTPDALVRFKREFRALQNVNHPNLVALGELISEGNEWYFTMDLVEGVDFLAYVRPFDRHPSSRPAMPTPGQRPQSEPPPGDLALAPTARFTRARLASTPDRGPAFSFDEVRLRSCLRQLALGLAALHSAGLVHRDIKPNNIRVTSTGRLVLLDFGLVGDIVGGKHETSGAKVVGTPAYMAPEQALADPVGPPADLYAVGVLLYEALTGTLPFKGASVSILVQKQQSEPAAPSSIVPGIPPDLDILCSALLHLDPKMRPSTESLLRALDVRTDDGAPRDPHQTFDVLFVGRTEEMETLTAAYRDSQLGKPVTVLLEGESGVGKSCLVKRFVDRLAADETELIVLQGRCYERESVPYKAFDGVVDSLAHFLSRLPKAEAALMLPTKPGPLVQVFPVLRRVEAIARMRHGQLALDPTEVRRRAFSAMRELLTRMSDHRPLVIVIEDMQWADADSQALLAELLRPPEAPALLLIATLRTGSGVAMSAPGQTLGEAMSVPSIRNLRDLSSPLPDARTIAIGRLPSEVAEELAHGLLERARPGSGVEAAAIAAEAEGHPLFIDALVRHGSSTVVAKGTRLDDALWEQVRRLDEPARVLMELLAIAGAPIPQDVLGTAAEVDPRTFATHVSMLRAAHLVQTTGMRGRDRIEPYHDRLRVTIRRHLDESRRIEHHRRIALAFETTGNNDAEMLAVHWRGAQDAEAALRYTVMAAQEAAQALAFDRAAKLYGQALELHRGADPERRELHARRGDALANAGRGALAARAFQSAAQGAKAAESLELRRMAADQLLRSGHFDAGLAAIEAVLASVGMKLPTAPWTALLYFLVMRFFITLRGLGFVERDSTQIAPEDLTRVDICWSVAFGLGLVDTVRAAAFQARHLTLALRTGEPYRVARALAIEVGYLGRGGGTAQKRSQRVMKIALAHAETTKSPHALGLTLVMSGVAEYLSGRFRRGLEFCDRAEQILVDECTGTAWELDTSRTFGLSCLAQLGDVQQLRERHPVYLREALDRGDLFGAVNLRVGHPNIRWLLDDDADGARADVAGAMEQWSKQGFHIEHYYELLALTQADLYSGAGARAHARVLERWPAFRRSLLQTVEMLGAMALQLRARSALAAAASGGGNAGALLSRANRDATALARLRMTWATPMAALLRAGVTVTRRGDDARAVAQLRDAVRGFEAAEMKLYAAAARRRLGGLVGGDAGAQMVREADEWMIAQTVKVPAKMTAMLAPGFERSG